jgi:hypothetical protein
MWTIADELIHKTQQFWRISQAWNGIGDEQLATGEAIVVCTENLRYTNPARPVFYRTESLLSEIIAGTASQRPEPAVIILFPSAATSA